MGNMKIVAYSDDTFTDKVPGGEYLVMLNPEKVQWGRQISYNEQAPMDSSAPSLKYNKTQSEKLSFELVIDCTGVVDDARTNLPEELALLSKVVYDYNGGIHSPNYLIIRWGAGLAFKCVLTAFNTSCTFFKPDGTPLRAKVSLEFSSYIDMKTLALRERKTSPDMSHLVTVVEGDTLPQISDRIYNSPNYYIQIAEFNQLDKFRELQPGTRLTAPPLVAKGVNNA